MSISPIYHTSGARYYLREHSLMSGLGPGLTGPFFYSFQVGVRANAS